MKSYKSTIIKKYGTDVEVQRYLGDMVKESTNTKALLGRATRTNTNFVASESQKEGIFLPYFDIDGGDFVIDTAHGEDFVVVTTHQEYDGNKVLSIVTNLLKCSHKMHLKGNVQVADDRGNIKTQFGTKYKDIPVYMEHISSQLLQYQAGVSPDTEHLLYTTSLNIDLTDQIVIAQGQRESVFKVVALDYLSFPNLVVVELAKDIRE